MSTARVAEHALEILKQDDLWDWPETRRIQASGKQSQHTVFRRITPKFLHYLIKESLNFSDRVLEQFLYQLGTCDKKIKNNIETLKAVNFVSAEESFDRLFQGLDPKDVDFQPVLNMAAEFFTHLGVAFMNPGGQKSGTGTPYAVSEFVSEETEKLLEELEGDGFGARKQRILKELSFRRDGHSCLLTRAAYMPFDDDGVPPDLAHIIPNSVHDKVDTLKCISMFAGTDASKIITQQLNNLGNVMNMQTDAHTAYDNLKWGIEAREEGGVVRYFFRLARTNLPNSKGPGFIALRDGDEIQFGAGHDKYLRKPNPELCNLRLAVARVMKMSAAADIVLKWKEEADDDGGDGSFIASEEYCDMLDAKLFLSGRAMVV